MTIRTEPLADPAEAEAVLLALRGDLDAAGFARRLAAAVAQGYAVIAAFDGPAMVGALGYRLVDDLRWGRSLFVDDLVVLPARRGQGIGAALMRAAEDVAAAEGCDALRLCSGLDRTEAHRFYEAQGMDRLSLHFAKPVTNAGPATKG